MSAAINIPEIQEYVERDGSQLERQLVAALAAAEAERDALAKQLDEALSANHDGGYTIIGLQAERDALRTALEEALQGLEAMNEALRNEIGQTFGSLQGEGLIKRVQEALVSSGSGGPGVHLTADQAETVASRVEHLYDHCRYTGCTCHRDSVLALLRPAVRGGGQEPGDET